MKISDDPEIQADYERMRRAGESHTIAEMLALQETPALTTDSTFLAGKCNGNQFEKTPHIGDYYRHVAESRGQNVKGKVYLRQLADYPGDPRAWVDGRGDVQRLCEERGDTCTGSVKVKGRSPGNRPSRPTALAEDIVEREVQDIIEDSPEPLKESRNELKEKVRAKRTPHWAK